MLIAALPKLKFILPSANRAFSPVIKFLNPHWPRLTRSEVRNPNSRGFTIIELVMVIVLISILAIYAAPKLGNITSMKGGAFADKLRADIRYAQNLAMTRGVRSRVDFSVGDQYAVKSSTTTTCSGFQMARDPATGGYLLSCHKHRELRRRYDHAVHELP